MLNRCNEVVSVNGSTHCHCTLEYAMQDGTRRDCSICGPQMEDPASRAMQAILISGREVNATYVLNQLRDLVVRNDNGRVTDRMAWGATQMIMIALDDAMNAE